VFRDRCSLVLHPHYVEGRENAANAARDADPTLRKKPKKTKAAAEPASIIYEAFSRVSHRCTISEILGQLQIRSILPGHTTKKEALLRLWETNSDIPDKRIAAAAAGGGVRPPAAAAAAAGDTGGGVRPPAAAAAAAGGVAQRQRVTVTQTHVTCHPAVCVPHVTTYQCDTQRCRRSSWFF
jgi:hypothetical protein